MLTRVLVNTEQVFGTVVSLVGSYFSKANVTALAALGIRGL